MIFWLVFISYQTLTGRKSTSKKGAIKNGFSDYPLLSKGIDSWRSIFRHQNRPCSILEWLKSIFYNLLMIRFDNNKFWDIHKKKRVTTHLSFYLSASNSTLLLVCLIIERCQRSPILVTELPELDNNWLQAIHFHYFIPDSH